MHMFYLNFSPNIAYVGREGVGCGLCCLVVLCAVQCNIGGEVKWKGTDVCLITLHPAAHMGGTNQQYHIICISCKQVEHVCNVLITRYAPAAAVL